VHPSGSCNFYDVQGDSSSHTPPVEWYTELERWEFAHRLGGDILIQAFSGNRTLNISTLFPEMIY
jgi:hypothetical protein